MKPIIGISIGDFNGIGPEVALKAALSPEVNKVCRPVLIGPLDPFLHYARKSRLTCSLREAFKFPLPAAPAGVIDVYTVWQYQAFTVQPGKETAEAGAITGEAITAAAQLALQGYIHGMVTGPSSKHAMNLAGYRYPGQTEMLAHITQSPCVMMMLLAGTFRVGLATVHMPLGDVSRALTKDRVLDKLTALDRGLRIDIGVKHPRIAVLGLNPHAGEQGMLGSEEHDVIIPAMVKAKKKGIHAEGPFPADGFFGRGMQKKYDAVLAMYHDQGLIPLKFGEFDKGVNFSAGLSIVRTSPDHGTAFDIAGKNKANPGSTIEALKLAAHVVKQRAKH